MSANISIANTIGKDLRTRSFFRRDIERIIVGNDTEFTLNFANVSFVSRSVADEIYNILMDHPNVKITGMTADVLSMYEVVVRSRQIPRQYTKSNAQVIQLTTPQEMQTFFESF